MSAVIGSAGSFGAFSALVTNSQTVSARLTKLQEQASTGYQSDTLGGLGATGAGLVLSLRPQIAHEAQYQANISAAQGQLDTTQSALSSISTIANQFYADIPKLSTLAPTQIDAIAASAKQALAQVAGLIDTKDGANYIFAGQTPGTAPIPNPDSINSSAFATSIAAAVAGLGTNGAAATMSTTLNAASGTSPFDPALSTTTPQVQVGDGQFVGIGLLANQNTFTTSSGSSTTGSYMRDVLRGLATIASLSSSQANTPGFSALVADTGQSLSGAISALGVEAGALGDVQNSLAARSTEIGETHDALQTQISSVMEVDMAATLSSLTQTQTALQVSYQVIAGAKNLSLANYI